MSVPPAAFPTVLEQMSRTKMADSSVRRGWRRVVVEKPFGHDLESARELNDLVDKVFTAPDGKSYRPSMFLTLTCDS